MLIYKKLRRKQRPVVGLLEKERNVIIEELKKVIGLIFLRKSCIFINRKASAGEPPRALASLGQLSWAMRKPQNYALPFSALISRCPEIAQAKSNPGKTNKTIATSFHTLFNRTNNINILLSVVKFNTPPVVFNIIKEALYV